MGLLSIPFNRNIDILVNGTARNLEERKVGRREGRKRRIKEGKKRGRERKKKGLKEIYKERKEGENSYFKSESSTPSQLKI